MEEKYSVDYPFPPDQHVGARKEGNTTIDPKFVPRPCAVCGEPNTVEHRCEYRSSNPSLVAELRMAADYLDSRMEKFDAAEVVNDRAQYVLLPSELRRAADEIENLRRMRFHGESVIADLQAELEEYKQCYREDGLDTLALKAERDRLAASLSNEQSAMKNVQECAESYRAELERLTAALSGGVYVPTWNQVEAELRAERDRLAAELAQAKHDYAELASDHGAGVLQCADVEAERDRLRRELDDTVKLAESLQNRWANRPLDHPSGEALMAENDRLQRLLDARPPYYCRNCGCASCGNTQPSDEVSRRAREALAEVKHED